MKSRYIVLLNGVSLNSLDENIYVSDISYQAIAPKSETWQLGSRNGAYSGNSRIDKNTVTISFQLRHYNTGNRQRTLQQIIRWAQIGGWLQTSDRQEQHMYVKCTRFPAITSALRWLDILSIEFTAFEYPYWVDRAETRLSFDGNGTKSLYVPGVCASDVEAVVTALSAVTEITLSCGDTNINLTGLSLSENDTVTLSYTEQKHILEIKAGNTSLLDKRTPESSDDLIAQPGENEFSFSADGSATCVFLIRGCWL